MKYLLTLYRDESRFADISPAELQQNMRRWDAYTRDDFQLGHCS